MPYVTDAGVSTLVTLLPTVVQFFQAGVPFGLPADLETVDTISSATPAVVETAAVHDYSTGDIVRFVFGTEVGLTGDVSLVNSLFKITVLTTTTFSIEHEGSRSGDVDGSLIDWQGGQVLKIRQLTGPWTVSQVDDVKYTQDADFLYLFHTSHEIRLIDEDLALSTVTFEDGPYLDLNLTATTLTPSGTSGSITITASAITGINGGQGFLVTDIGRLIRMLDSASNWTWLTITAHASTTSITATVSGEDLTDTSAVTSWRLGLFSDTTGHPVHGVRHEGRLWLCSDAETGRVDGSEIIENQLTKSVFSFAPTAVDGTVADSNAVAVIFDSEKRNRLNWLAADDTGLLGGAEEGIWSIQASSLDDPITPTSIQARRKTRSGSSDTQAVLVNRSTVFVDALERQLVEIRRYESGYDIKIASRTGDHLITEGLAEIQYSNSPVPIIWGRTNDQRLVGVSFRRDIDGEQTGWHDQDLTYWLDPDQTATLGKVLSIATLPKSDIDESLEETLWVCVERNGFYSVEILSRLFDASRIELEEFFVDSGVGYDSEGFSSTWNKTGDNQYTFYGLWHLEGNTVDVVFKDVDLGTGTVSGGQVTVQVPPEALLLPDASLIYNDSDNDIWFIDEYTRDFTPDFVSAQATVVSPTPNGGGYVLGEDGNTYYISNRHIVDRATGTATQVFSNAILHTAAQASGIDPTGRFEQASMTTSVFAVTGTKYIITVVNFGLPAGLSPAEVIATMYWKINSSGAVELVGAYADTVPSVVVTPPPSGTNMIIGVGFLGNGTNTLTNDMLMVFAVTTRATKVLRIPSVAEMLGQFIPWESTSTTSWSTRLESIDEWGDELLDPTFTGVSIDIPMQNRVSIVPTRAGGTPAVYIMMHMNRDFAQSDIAGSFSRSTAFSLATATANPDGYLVAVLYTPDDGVSGAIGDSQLFNGRFRDASATALVPFADAGFDRFGDRNSAADDYFNPSVYPTDPDDALKPWLIFFPKVYYSDDTVDPTGTYMGLRVFQWSPVTGTATQLENLEGSLFDMNAQLGVANANNLMQDVTVQWDRSTGRIEFLMWYNSGSVPVSPRAIVAGFGTLTVALDGLIQQQALNRGFDAVVGLNYSSRGQILRPQEGGRNGPMLGKTRRIDQFAVHTHRTGQIQFGTNFEDMTPNFLTHPGDDATDDSGRRPLFSGVYEGALNARYDFDSMIAWEQPRPAPGTILSIGGFLKVSDR
jgi:hypothetical protein